MQVQRPGITRAITPGRTGFELAKRQVLNLKLINFLAKHQLRAKIKVRAKNGMEFVIRFKE